MIRNYPEDIFICVLEDSICLPGPHIQIQRDT